MRRTTRSGSAASPDVNDASVDRHQRGTLSWRRCHALIVKKTTGFEGIPTGTDRDAIQIRFSDAHSGR